MKGNKRNERIYVPVPGSHLSKDDAKRIGQGIELLFDKFGQTPQLVDKFAEAVKSRSNPAYPVVQKKYEEFKNRAWRNAVQYCLGNVDCIQIDIKGEEVSREKGVILLNISSKDDSEKKAPKERYEINTADTIRDDPDRLAMYEDDFRGRFHTLVTDFANVVGMERAVSIIADEMNGIVNRELELVTV